MNNIIPSLHPWILLLITGLGAGAMSLSSSSNKQFCVKNFRPVGGLPKDSSTMIYRCAKTDDLAKISSFSIAQDSDEKTTGRSITNEEILLKEAGLILDLRAPSERNEALAQQWMTQSGFTWYDINPDTWKEEKNKNKNRRQRNCLRIDVLSTSRFMNYANQYWLDTPAKRALGSIYGIFDLDKQHAMTIHELNQRGLFGLNQAILETGKQELAMALKEITLHLERKSFTPIIFHCVQGKDRTGLLAMLCQSMWGVCDEDIIEDYHKSDAIMRKNRPSSSSSSAAATSFTNNDNEKLKPGKLDRKVFAGAPRQAMIDTLQYLRIKYKSICPGYLDDIGFDAVWRERFQKALLGENHGKQQPCHERKMASKL